jgi:hypothetical protein
MVQFLMSSPALSQAVSPGDPKICKILGYQIKHLSKDTDPSEWPRKIDLDGLSWPNWIPIKPAKHLNIIKKALFWPYARQNHSAWPPAEYYFAYGTSSQQEYEWKILTAPYYLNAIKNGTLVMETATIDFLMEGDELLDVPAKATVIRFRITPDSKTLLKRIAAKQYYLLGQYNWQYVIESLSDNKIIADTPVSSDGDIFQGEIALIDQRLVIFHTDYPNVGVDYLFFHKDEPSVNEYNILSTGPICLSYR